MGDIDYDWQNEQPEPEAAGEEIVDVRNRHQEEYMQQLLASLKHGLEASMGCTLEEKENREKQNLILQERKVVALERIAEAICFSPHSIGYAEAKENFESY